MRVVAWLVPHRPVLRTIARVLAAVYALRLGDAGDPARLSTTGSGYSAAAPKPNGMPIRWPGSPLPGPLWRSVWCAATNGCGALGLIGVGLVVAQGVPVRHGRTRGVLRALSFIGLGGALVGLGYAYRRLRPLQQSEGPNAPAT